MAIIIVNEPVQTLHKVDYISLHANALGKKP